MIAQHTCFMLKQYVQSELIGYHHSAFFVELSNARDYNWNWVMKPRVIARKYE